ncbi:hypothetical protein FHW88_005412 [Mucilaginibacter sp. SG538B]|uniref:hypothetical protein n=1 Tax=unclassified Mucilaginibacter TaxID=2617802 RepID=UPI0008719326|nr:MULTISPECIES: hypothetical protein [unclassified Mucilaginibacter]NVM67091.1 hypothetical protein [Mucilaginibacter sp. SG538B]SCW88273.1 hypothetical protein SAMN03159284_05358 [Mucilaginibacter sp. NFR10]
MYKLLLILLISTTPILCLGQTQYVLTKVSYQKVKPDGSLEKAPFKDLPKGVRALLFSNALTISGLDVIGESYKFVRKINQQEKDGVHVKWIALDRNENAFQIMILDFGNYSRIGILNQKTRNFTLYETL